ERRPRISLRSMRATALVPVACVGWATATGAGSIISKDFGAVSTIGRGGHGAKGYRSHPRPCQAPLSTLLISQSSSSNQTHAASPPEVAMMPPSKVDLVHGHTLPSSASAGQFPLV